MASNVTRNPSLLTRPLEVLNTSSQLKLSYDAVYYAAISVANNGATTIATTDGAGGSVNANLILDIDGDIELNADGGDITFKDGGTTLGSFDSFGNFSITNNLLVSGAMTQRGDVVFGLSGSDDAVSLKNITTIGETAGKNLTISAGSTQTAEDYNLDGGDLILKAGDGDGTGTSAMTFFTKVNGTDATAERMRIHTNGKVGIGEATPDAWLEITGTTTQLKLSYDTADYMSITVADDGATTLNTVDGGAGVVGHFTLEIDGDITLDAAGDNIYLASNGTNVVDFDVTGSGGAGASMKLMSILDSGDYFMIDTTTNGATTIATVDDDAAVAHINIEADGHVEFDGCAVGFDLETPTYDAIDTDVSFITGNKQFVTFDGGNITDLNLIFPETSGNFVLLLKQDGNGGRGVLNYKAWDLVNSDAADGSATVKFAGGSNPTLTTDANHVDIISFFWDADNEIAYGVASLDFQF